MAKIGIVDVDSTSFPNLALMKIAAYHKSLGDVVEWVSPLFADYDKVYLSKVFTFTPDYPYAFNCEMERGGTGYDLKKKLPDYIDRQQPDYSIYGITDTAYGFLTRGCPNKCKWCVVPKKEGAPVPYMDIEEIARDRRKVILMDNNILALEYGLQQLEKIAGMRIRVDFNQGIDARLINDETAKLLARVKWIRYIRFACDQTAQIPYIEKAYRLLTKYGYHGNVFTYCLLNDFRETIARVNYLRGLSWVVPHFQPYRDFNNPHQIIPQWQKDLARWANMRAIYNTVELQDYEPRKGFKFGKYFDLNNGD